MTRVTIDTAILNALRATDRGVSGAEIAAQLGVTRAAVWSRVQELRSLGYDIQASPHQGYRLGSVPDLLHAEDLLSRLGSRQVIGRDVRVFQETTSTNDVVEKLARDGVREGVVVLAESQTRGRGRLGRVWASRKGKGLWFSVLLRPGMAPREVTRLTILAAVSVSRAVEQETGLTLGIKWPNDLLVGQQKIAGILTEMHGELDKVKYVILGIGVNVNQRVSDFPAGFQPIATSLSLALGRKLVRAELAASVIRSLDEDYARLTGGCFDELSDEWARRCVTLGKRVTIMTGGNRVQGTAEALDADGSLLLRTPFGMLERVTGGDVSLER